MDIASILNSLSPEDVSRLRETAESVLGGAKTENPKSGAAGAMAVPSQTEMLTAAAKFSSLMTQRDERSELLLALKPFLSGSRRQKADQAAMMLRLLRVIDSLRGRKN